MRGRKAVTLKQRCLQSCYLAAGRASVELILCSKGGWHQQSYYLAAGMVTELRWLGERTQLLGRAGVVYETKPDNDKSNFEAENRRPLPYLLPRILESLPPFPRQHSSAIGCTKNYQPIGVTVHSLCVESIEGLLQRCRRGRGCSEL